MELRLKLLVTFSAFSLVGCLVGTSSVASAQIVPGAYIPLDPTKATDTARITDIVEQCYYEEALASLIPQAAGSALDPNVEASFESSTTIEEDLTGTNQSWVKTQWWYPSFTRTMNYLEWETPAKSVSRELTLECESGGSTQEAENSSMNCYLSANVAGRDVDVRLVMEEAAMPYVIIEKAGATDCTSNEWGNNTCREVVTNISSVNLAIPNGFVPTGPWINEYTTRPSQKLFNFQKYAECILWKWDK